MKRLVLLLLSFCLSLVAKENRSGCFERGDVEAVLESMTVSEKVGQLLIAFFIGDSAEQDLAPLVKRVPIGNLIYYGWAHTLENPQFVKALSCNIQTVMRKVIGVPALLAIDQEGGKVSRLKGQFTRFISPQEMGKLKREEIFELGFKMGSEMYEAGIHLNFSPVVDVAYEGSIMQERSFGFSADSVIAAAIPFIAGLHKAKVAVTLKHFVGLGHSAIDSHLGLPSLDYTYEQLLCSEDFKPFAALSNEAEAIMTAHIALPKIDSKVVSQSAVLVQKLLREQLRYSGLIITDSLVMRGATAAQHSLQDAICEVSQAALQAFMAGNDMLILGRFEWDHFNHGSTEKRHFEKHETMQALEQLVEAIINRFQTALDQGILSQERLNEAVRRILCFKYQKIAA